MDKIKIILILIGITLILSSLVFDITWGAVNESSFKSITFNLTNKSLNFQTNTEGIHTYPPIYIECTNGITNEPLQVQDINQATQVCRDNRASTKWYFNCKQVVTGSGTITDDTNIYRCENSIDSTQIADNPSGDLPDQDKEEQNAQITFVTTRFDYNNQTHDGECSPSATNKTVSICRKPESGKFRYYGCVDNNDPLATIRYKCTVDKGIIDDPVNNIKDVNLTQDELEYIRNVGGNYEDATMPTTGNVVASPISYKSFTAFPGIGQISSLCELTKALWFIGYAILFISVIGMYMYGGFLYTSSGVNASGINQAKGIFTNATTGLVLGLSVYVIINTLNPSLLNTQCTITPVPNAPVGSGASSSVNSNLLYTSNNPGECKGTGNGIECIGGGLTGTCKDSPTEPFDIKFQGSVSSTYTPVDDRLKKVAEHIFAKCSSKGNFQISSATAGNHAVGSLHYKNKALDFADVSPNFTTKETAKCIIQVARSCGVSTINPDTDAKKTDHIHIDLQGQ